MTNALYADLGRTDYKATLQVQHDLVGMRNENTIPDIILITEHNPALLFGRNKTSFSHAALAAAQEKGKHPNEHVKELGLDVHHEQPFKSAHYTGPGQLSFYPIVDYTRLLAPRDAAGYNAIIGNIITDSLREIGIDTKNGRFKDSRIASKAVRLGQRIASHGFHVHVNSEGVKHFKLINVDGDSSFISIEDILGYKPLHDDVKKNVLGALKKNMKYDRIEACQIRHTEDGILIRKQ